jgi:CHAT domain-containing protein/AAA ATPase-like protein
MRSPCTTVSAAAAADRRSDPVSVLTKRVAFLPMTARYRERGSRVSDPSAGLTARRRRAENRTMGSLILTVEDRPNGDYPVTVTESGKVLAEGVIARDLPDAQGMRDTLVADEEPEPARVDEIGIRLFDMLGDVGLAWSSRAAEADARGDPLPVLLDIRPEPLALLPWEMLFDQPNGIQPFGRADAPVTRVYAYDHAAAPPEDDYWPLRILVVVGSDAPGIHALEERGKLDDALASLCAHTDIDVCEKPATIDDLYAAIEEQAPHILHFIGHGVVDGNGAGALRFEVPGQENWDWTARMIRQRALPFVPRLVILNACRTGGAAAEERGDDPKTSQFASWAVGAAFLYKRVPAVLSMQGPIDGDLAARFAERFYGALADRAPIDVAVAKGRDTIAANEPANYQSRQVWLPSLTISAPPESVLPPRYRIEKPRFDRVQTVIQPLGPFVDRRSDRKKLLKRLDLHEAVVGDLDPRLIVVTGDENTGKTELVKWALAQLSYRGASGVYVDLRSNGTRDFFDVITLIHRALLDMIRLKEEDKTPLDDFENELRSWRESEKRPVGDQRHSLARSLVEGMRALAEERPLVVALDHLESADEEDFREAVSPNLLKPVVFGNAAHTRVILVHRRTTGITGELPTADPVELQGFEAGEGPTLFRQYLRFHRIDWDEHIEKLVIRNLDERWRPDRLRRFREEWFDPAGP